MININDYSSEDLQSLVNKMESSIAELQAENERLKEAQRWRIVANGELPETSNDEYSDNYVLAISIKSKEYDVGSYSPKHGWLNYDEQYHSWSREVTHWMPLPGLPEVEG